MRPAITLCCGVFLPASLPAQTVEVVVQRLPDRGPSVPAADAVVRASQSPHQRGAAGRRPIVAQRLGPDQNVYRIDPSPLGSPIDITIRVDGYHDWVVRDLSLAPGQDQRIAVQLFHHNYPIRAPECFALKTQYELLFRKEQQLDPGASKAEIEHRARVKYGDGLLALPNPNREHLQSEQTRRMLAAMSPEDRGELGNMLDGLFELYEMDQFEQYVPSTWDTAFIAPNGRRVPATVRLLGTRGTYVTDAGTHRLEGVDILSDQEGAVIIQGRWRFRPGSPDEQTGNFRWVVGEDGREFKGTPNWSGTLLSGPHDNPN